MRHPTPSLGLLIFLQCLTLFIIIRLAYADYMLLAFAVASLFIFLWGGKR